MKRPTSPPDILSLIGAQKAEFNYAANRRSQLLKTQMAIGLLAASTAFFEDHRILYFAAVAGVILAALWLYLAIDLAKSRSHAERLRRSTLVSGGLGVSLDGADLMELAVGGRAKESEAKRLIDPDYFASASPPGKGRFVEMLEESAIWTTNLAGFAATEAWGQFGISIAASALAIFASVEFADRSMLEAILRAFFAIAVVLLSVDFLGAAWAYRNASVETRRIIDRLQAHKGGKTPLERVMIIFAEYNSAVEAMPLFPSGLHARHEVSLNEKYKLYLTGPQ